MGEPLAVTQALVADALAQRYGGRPSRWLKADARDLQIAEIASAVHTPPKAPPKASPQTPREKAQAEAANG